MARNQAGKWVALYKDFPYFDSGSSQIPGKQGVTYVADIEQTIIRPEVADELFMLTTNIAPLTVLTRMTRKEPVGNIIFEWYADDLAPYATKVGVNFLGGTTPDTTITVASGTAWRFRVNDVVFFPKSGEYMLVTAVDTTNDQITVTRDITNEFGGTNQPALQGGTAGDPIIIVGSAFPEGSNVPESVRTTKRVQRNILQIVKRTVEVTGTALAIRNFFNTSELGYQKAKLLKEFALEIERVALFGKVDPTILDTGGDPTSLTNRTTNGILSLLGWDEYGATANTNILDITAGLNLGNWISFFKEVFAYHPNEQRILVASPDLISWMVREFNTSTAINVTQWREFGNDRFSMKLRTLEFQFGELALLPHPMLRYGGKVAGIVVVPSKFSYCYLSGNGYTRDLIQQVRRIPNENMIDSWKVSLLAEVGFKLVAPELFGLIIYQGTSPLG